MGLCTSQRKCVNFGYFEVACKFYLRLISNGSTLFSTAMSFTDDLLSTQPIRVACSGCKKKFLEMPGWFNKKGASCPSCGAPFSDEAIRRATKSLEKRIHKTVETFEHVQ